MTKYLKCNFILLLLPFFAFAGSDTETAQKRIEREFSIRPDGRLEIENRHGNIDIAIGPAGSVKMDILITVSSGSKSKSAEALDRIDIFFEEGNNRVSATTEIEAKESGWKSWFSSGKQKIDIRYQVRVPADVFLEISNKFGNIYVETTDRDIDIDLAYGKLQLGDINADLSVDMDYGDGSLSQVKNADFELAYSNLEMENADDVDMEVKYGRVKAGSFKKLTLESASTDLILQAIDKLEAITKYGSLHADMVGSMNAETSFTTVTIDALTSAGNFNMRYGDLRIQSVSRNFTGLNINSSYTGVHLKFAPGASYTLDAITNYCDITYTQLKVIESLAKNTNRVLKGTVGGGSASVNARMNYGELRLE